MLKITLIFNGKTINNYNQVDYDEQTLAVIMEKFIRNKISRLIIPNAEIIFNMDSNKIDIKNTSEELQKKIREVLEKC